jgi:hypothetical protein
MDIASILKIIWFIILLWLFFSFGIVNKIFLSMQEYISLFNINFFSKIPVEILFLFVFFIFIIVLSFILSFFRKD